MKKLNKEKFVNLYGIIWTSIVILIYVIQPVNFLEVKYFSNIDKIIMLTGVIHIFLYKFCLKKNIIKNKFDFFLIIFLLTMILPIVVNTYISLSSTVQYIFKYTNFVLVYFITKNSVIKGKNINTLLNVFLFAVSITTIYGIDIETTRFINDALGLMNYKENADYNIYRFNYIYHNVLSIVMLVGIIISQYKLLSIKGNKKILIYMSIFLSSIGFYLAFSRISIFILILFEIVFLFICIKKRQGIKELICFYISFVLAIIFSNILKQRMFNNNYLNLWLLFVCIAIINCFVCKFIDIVKLKKININININKLIPFFIALFIALVTFVVIALNTSEPIVINENNISDIGSRYYTLTGVSHGEHGIIVQYDLGNSVIANDSDEIIGYTICIYGVLENGKYEVLDIISATNRFEDHYGNFIYNEKYKEIKICISNVSNKIEDISINLVQLDGKEYILNYKYMPYSIVYCIKSINLNNVSVNERINLYKDAVNISLKNKFIGLGARAWAHIFEEYKSYNYYTSEVHSRILEILINFGLIGVIVYVIVIIYYLIYNLKRCKDINSILLISIPIIIFIQSSLDWILSENVILLIMFMTLGIVNYEINESNKLFKIFENIMLIVVVSIFLLVLYLWIVEIKVDMCNKIDPDIFRRKYLSDYLIFRDDERQNKLISLQGLVVEKEELNEEIFKLLYERLKYERNIDYDLNLVQYLKIAKDFNYEIDKKLVKKVIDDMNPDNRFSVQEVCEYIRNLNYIKEFVNNVVEYEQLNLITTKINYEYEQLMIKLKNYSELAINYNSHEMVNDENIKLVLDYVNEYKKFCYNE